MGLHRQEFSRTRNSAAYADYTYPKLFSLPQPIAIPSSSLLEAATAPKPSKSAQTMRLRAAAKKRQRQRQQIPGQIRPSSSSVQRRRAPRQQQQQQQQQQQPSAPSTAIQRLGISSARRPRTAPAPLVQRGGTSGSAGGAGAGGAGGAGGGGLGGGSPDDDLPASAQSSSVLTDASGGDGDGADADERLERLRSKVKKQRAKRRGLVGQLKELRATAEAEGRAVVGGQTRRFDRFDPGGFVRARREGLRARAAAAVKDSAFGTGAQRGMDVVEAERKARGMPAPGSYEPVNPKHTISKGTKFLLAQPKTDVDWAVYRASTQPSPGSYDPVLARVGHQAGAFSKFTPKGEIDWAIYRGGMVPAAGHCQPDGGFSLVRPDRGSKFSLANPKSDVELLEYEARQMPGPGAYEVVPFAGDAVGGKIGTGDPKGEVDWAMYRGAQLPAPGHSQTLQNTSTLVQVGGGFSLAEPPNDVQVLMDYHRKTPGPGGTYDVREAPVTKSHNAVAELQARRARNYARRMESVHAASRASANAAVAAAATTQQQHPVQVAARAAVATAAAEPKPGGASQE